MDVFCYCFSIWKEPLVYVGPSDQNKGVFLKYLVAKSLRVIENPHVEYLKGHLVKSFHFVAEVAEAQRRKNTKTNDLCPSDFPF